MPRRNMAKIMDEITASMGIPKELVNSSCAKLSVAVMRAEERRRRRYGRAFAKACQPMVDTIGARVGLPPGTLVLRLVPPVLLKERKNG